MIASVKKSLSQLLGADYANAVARGSICLFDRDEKEVHDLFDEVIDFLPDQFINKMERLIDSVGQTLIHGLEKSLPGAATSSFDKATHINASPLAGLGFIRLGEDGRIYLVSKSEHYHAPLGHSFPGYKLLENARSLGITNTTHNNTRGYITRFLETELIRTVNGLELSDNQKLEAILSSTEKHVLNRVINLETGSLAVEAGIKMMLSRFYKLEKNTADSKHKGKTPVFLVMGDNEGGSTANYHGTTIIAQLMRNLWPDLGEKFAKNKIMKIVPVQINNWDDFQAKFFKYNKGRYQIAGFIHEIILMNYGAIKLQNKYLTDVYTLCHANDVPVLVDEIQSCMWFPGFYLFRDYHLQPDFIAIGKGFSGGQYPASKIITTCEMDNLSQFGALVTNGQEELASLAYLITMEFTRKNEQHILETGQYYENKLKELAESYPKYIKCIEGKAHLSSIHFRNYDYVKKFVIALNEKCIDISAQNYKENSSAAALTKLPTIATQKMVDYICAEMSIVLSNGFISEV